MEHLDTGNITILGLLFSVLTRKKAVTWFAKPAILKFIATYDKQKILVVNLLILWKTQWMKIFAFFLTHVILSSKSESTLGRTISNTFCWYLFCWESRNINRAPRPRKYNYSRAFVFCPNTQKNSDLTRQTSYLNKYCNVWLAKNASCQFNFTLKNSAVENLCFFSLTDLILSSQSESKISNLTSHKRLQNPFCCR